MKREEIRERVHNILEQGDIVLDYSKPIEIDDISRILDEMLDLDFYIECLVSSCGNGEWSTHLDYYDRNLGKVVLVDTLKYSYGFENEDEVIEFIEELYDSVEATKNRLKSSAIIDRFTIIDSNKNILLVESEDIIDNEKLKETYYELEEEMQDDYTDFYEELGKRMNAKFTLIDFIHM